MPCYQPLNMIQRDGAKKLVTYRYGDKGIRMLIPCGRCVGCRLERSRQWAMRCWHESQLHDRNAFVTLTYRDDEIVLGNYRPTLYPKHLQDFWKRLRKRLGNESIRYFACGEYGESTYRPHYHACIFGFDFPDKKFYTIKNGNRLYSSDMLDSVWSHGDTRIGDVTFESAAYIARYIVGKKLGDDAVFYDEERIEPEFVVMSRKPGIGAGWVDKYKSDVFPGDVCVLPSGVESSPPRFYMERLKRNDFDMYQQVKYARTLQLIEQAKDENNHGTRLKIRGRLKKRQLMQFRRDFDV